MKRVVPKWTTKAQSLTGIRTTTTPMLSTKYVSFERKIKNTIFNVVSTVSEQSG